MLAFGLPAESSIRAPSCAFLTVPMLPWLGQSLTTEHHPYLYSRPLKSIPFD